MSSYLEDMEIIIIKKIQQNDFKITVTLIIGSTGIIDMNVDIYVNDISINPLLC